MRSDEANGALAIPAREPEVKPALFSAQREIIRPSLRFQRRNSSHSQSATSGEFGCLLRRCTPSASDIDEIVQDAWLVAWKKIDLFRYRGETADEEFVRWLCTIARYEVMKYRRKSVPRLVLDEQVIDKLAALQFDEADYFEARHEALSVCIENLRPRDKALVRRRYEENMSVHDLADWIGRSADAVYKSLNRIRTSLLACIERTLKREGYF